MSCSACYALLQNCKKRLLASSYLSVRLSASYNAAPTGRISMKFYIGNIFIKSVEESQVALTSDKNSGYFT